MNINNICPGCMTEIADRETASVCPHCGYDLMHIASDLHQLQPFTFLAGKYLVGRVIGEGGFGITYLGYDLNLELKVAIKEFYPNGFVTRESNNSPTVIMYSGKNEANINKWRDGFIKEAKNLARFSNLNGIVEVRDFFNENNTAYIVMEYVDGITLKQYLKQNGGKLSPEQTFEKMEPVIRALSKVHDAGIIHRDISPDNIMFTKHGGMKLLDFGAARDFASEQEKSLSIMLKPGYAPEEQYRSHGKQGPWTDVYALTATIYKCLTGVTPVESMERMREDSLKMPGELGIKLTKEQEMAIKNGMAVYAENRIQNMDILYKEIYSQNNSVKAEKEPVSSQIASSLEKVKMPEVKMPEIKMPEIKMPEIKKPDTEEIKTQFFESVNTNRKPIIAILSAACVIMFIVCIVVALPSGGNKNNDTNTSAESTSKLDMVVESEEENTAKKDVGAVKEEVKKLVEEKKEDDISDQIREIESGIGDYKDENELAAALDAYLELAKEYGNICGLGEKVYSTYNYYSDIVMNRINNCNNNEPAAALYTQITIDLEKLLGYSENFEKCTIGVNSEDAESINTNFKQNYKNRIINNFDSYASNQINKNNVVSRSELWAKMEGIKDTDLYDSNNPYDPVRLRYSAALALHVDSMIENLSRGQAIQTIYDNIYEADYNPYLIYLLDELGDSNAGVWLNTFEYYLAGYTGDNYSYFNSTYKKNFTYIYASDQYYKEVRELFWDYMDNEL